MKVKKKADASTPARNYKQQKRDYTKITSGSSLKFSDDIKRHWIVKKDECNYERHPCYYHLPSGYVVYYWIVHC